MELIRTWILSVTVSAIIISVADAVMPDGAVKKVGKLTGGLILMLGILQPIVTMDYDDLYDMVNAFPVGSIRQEALEESASAPLQAGIEARLAAYIADKAAALGADCTAEVLCETDENGVPIPVGVTVSGSLTGGQQAALSETLTGELGLPPTQQTFLCEETP